MNELNKKYRSYHDIPPRDYMYFPKGTIELGNPGEFSRLEITHLLLSIIALTLAFSFALTNNNLIEIYFGGFNLDRLIIGLIKSFLGVIIAFFCHEISHKLIAQKYRLWSEYRMNNKGIILALILGLLTPIVFAAPGAVIFRGKVRIFEMGLIAIAGPLANIILASITFTIYLFISTELIILNEILAFVCLINAVIATYNLLPFQVFDGNKILKWNSKIWFITFLVSFVLMILVINEIFL
jgi:Zn-dependent protease